MSVHPKTTSAGNVRYVVRWRDGKNRSKSFPSRAEAEAYDERVVRRSLVTHELHLPRSLARGLAEALAQLPPLGPGADPIIESLLRNAYEVEDALARAAMRADASSPTGYAALRRTERPVGGYGA